MRPHDDPTPRRRSGLLVGLRVLDLTRFLAGPFGSMILADMGADVVKIEDLTGDSTRSIPPHFFNGDSAYYLSVNRSKRSIACDLRSSEGQEVLRHLVRSADVILDNLRPRQRDKLGVSYEAVSRINPRIVACSITGFGSTGPYVDRPAYDIVVQALSGVMSLTGEPDGDSVRTGVPIGDLAAGMYLVMGVLGALYERSLSGKGQHIDISMLDCQVSLLTYLASYYFVDGTVPGRQGRAHLSIPTYNTFVAADEIELVVAANTEEMWHAMCRVLGRPDLIDTPAYATNADRLRNRDQLLPQLRRAFRSLPAAEWYQRLTAAGVPCAPINRMDRVFSDPQVRHRNMKVQIAHRDGGSFEAVGNPVKASRTYADEFTSPPGLGEQTVEILAEVGFSAEDIRRLTQSGRIKTHPDRDAADSASM